MRVVRLGAMALCLGIPAWAASPIETIPAARAAGHACAAAMGKLTAVSSPSFDESARAAFVECLAGYVRIPSLDAEREELAVQYLAAVLDDLGIPYRTFTTKGQGDDRATHPNLVATLTPAGAKLRASERDTFDWAAAPARDSIVLMNHTDVVPVAPKQWERESLPFSGEVAPAKEDPAGPRYVWGRGALDMKGIGMLQLFAMAIAKREGVALDKDVHFLAVADEEKLSSGVVGAIAEIRPGGQLAALARARVALGEGGMGVKGAIGSRSILHLVNNEEKGGAWLRLGAASAEALFAALERMSLLGDSGGRSRAARWACRVVDAETPEAQVNVVASRLTIELQCDRAPQAEALLAAIRKAAPAMHADVAPKGGGRFRVTVSSATAAHGAFARGATLPQSLALALEKIGALQRHRISKPAFYRYKKTSATVDLLNTIGANETFAEIFGTNRFLLPSVSSLGTHFPERLLGMVGKQLFTEALFRTSCAWTAFERRGDRFEALVDCRLLRPTSSREFVSTVEKLVEPVTVAPISQWDFSQSPADYWAYQALKRTLESERTRELRVAPSQWLAPNGSDNNFFRNPRAELGHAAFAGIPAYGFFPIVVRTGLISTQHGSDERFPVDEMAPGVRRYWRALEALAGK